MLSLSVTNVRLTGFCYIGEIINLYSMDLPIPCPLLLWVGLRRPRHSSSLNILCFISSTPTTFFINNPILPCYYSIVLLSTSPLPPYSTLLPLPYVPVLLPTLISANILNTLFNPAKWDNFFFYSPHSPLLKQYSSTNASITSRQSFLPTFLTYQGKARAY